MKYIFFITLAAISINATAQATFHNFGNIQIHDQGQIGFHGDLINNGTFNQNLGLAGFYSTSVPLTISGNEIPRFYDMEVDVPNALFLNINTEVSNSLSFSSGHIITPRLDPTISIDFLNNAINILEENLKNTDGYASYTGNSDFTFPIGDDDKLRPLITPFQTGNPKFSAAYFNENPNFPSTFPSGFDTTTTEAIATNISLNVSLNEFWDFDGTGSTTVTLTWDADSQIINLVDEIINLRVVGWNISESKWVNLGNLDITGSFTEGTITSSNFTPNEYSIITLGGIKGAVLGVTSIVIYNGVSPNGDGKNDTFTIDGIENLANTLEIFNRWGRIVYDTENYKNNWDGVSNKETFGKNGEKLPVGTYYYVLKIKEDDRQFAGWLYINY
jgi:gliding motility-associated-like protein